MLITLDTQDTRTAKAFALADQAASWLKCRTADGRKSYGIRSVRNPNVVYLATATSCTCPDAKRHPQLVCKHSLAVQIHIARVGCAGKPQPASDVVAGLEQMVEARPLLTSSSPELRRILGRPRPQRQVAAPFPVAVQVDPDEIVFERQRTAALAEQYDAIFSRFED